MAAPKRRLRGDDHLLNRVGRPNPYDPEPADVCLHYGIAWRALRPARDGRLHATCACGTAVTRSAFPKESR